MAVHGRPGMRGPRTGAAVLAVLALIVGFFAACSPLAGFGASIRRDGSLIQVSFPGRGEPDARGWLCPADPGPGEIWSKAGAARLETAGCLDLGFNTTPQGAAPAWLGRLDLATLDGSRLVPFAGRTAWHLIVVTGGEGFEKVSTTQIAAIALQP
ncbi:MAG: hypothetical protein HYX57_12320 [Chloroflexi bacterium]|nr:hypothetical protein [Chloroflexota bacterium]